MLTNAILGSNRYLVTYQKLLSKNIIIQFILIKCLTHHTGKANDTFIKKYDLFKCPDEIFKVFLEMIGCNRLSTGSS